MNRTAPLETRFWSKVDKRGLDECWPWLGWAINGYGHIKINGVKHVATRLSWSLANGRDFPVGHFACHTCDNPGCVNPAHIWAGTPRDNMTDMASKGRSRNGLSANRETCSRGHLWSEQRPYPSDAGRRCRTCHYERTYLASAQRRAAARSL